MKTILLTFDVEEFDLPGEFGISLSKKEEFEISKQGLLSILDLLNKYNIKATFFTTADFAKKYPKIIKNIDREGHEIACHGYSHSDSYIEDLSRISLAKKEIEKIIKKSISGFRAPRFEIKDISRLADFGFVYDSSVFPTIVPGRYINLSKSRKIHKIGKIIEMPLSTLPLFPFLRAPFNWYMFRNFPAIYGKFFTTTNSFFSNYLMLILHPWEFVNLVSYNLPKSFKKNTGKQLLNRLSEYLKFARKRYEFETVNGYLGI